MSAKNSCKTAAVMGLLSKGTTAERDVQLLADKHRDIETITAEILEAKRVGGEAILVIGKGLIEAKATLPHGEWLPWLEDRVEISTRMAQKYMRLAQHYSNTNALSYLGATKALQLLALPESERDEFLNELHEVGGERKNAIGMTSRELAIVIKERDDALRTAAQAQADQAAAEQAREKMSQDMKLANERIAGLNAEVEKRSAEAGEARETAARLERELEELRSRPREVAVEADTAAVEAARKEAEERMQAQLDAAKKAQAQVEQAKKDAEDAKAQAQEKLIRAVAKLQDAQTQAEAAEKRAALTSSEDLALFRALFDQTQELANKMGGVLLKVRPKDPEKAQGLSKALIALADRFREVARQ